MLCLSWTIIWESGSHSLYRVLAAVTQKKAGHLKMDQEWQWQRCKLTPATKIQIPELWRQFGLAFRQRRRVGRRTVSSLQTGPRVKRFELMKLIWLFGVLQLAISAFSCFFFWVCVQFAIHIYACPLGSFPNYAFKFFLPKYCTTRSTDQTDASVIFKKLFQLSQMAQLILNFSERHIQALHTYYRDRSRILRLSI